MIFKWYKIFNLTDFEATGLVSRTVTLFLQDVGLKDILITKGNFVSMLYEDTFLPINFLDKNPYSTNGYGIYLDADQDVWLGIEVEA